MCVRNLFKVLFLELDLQTNTAQVSALRPMCSTCFVCTPSMTLGGLDWFSLNWSPWPNTAAPRPQLYKSPFSTNIMLITTDLTEVTILSLLRTWQSNCDLISASDLCPASIQGVNVNSDGQEQGVGSVGQWRFAALTHRVVTPSPHHAVLCRIKLIQAIKY